MRQLHRITLWFVIHTQCSVLVSWVDYSIFALDAFCSLHTFVNWQCKLGGSLLLLTRSSFSYFFSFLRSFSYWISIDAALIREGDGESVKENWKIYHCKMISMEYWNHPRAYHTFKRATSPAMHNVTPASWAWWKTFPSNMRFYVLSILLLYYYYWLLLCALCTHIHLKSLIFALIQYETHASDQYGNGVGLALGVFACDKIYWRMTTIFRQMSLQIELMRMPSHRFQWIYISSVSS